MHVNIDPEIERQATELAESKGMSLEALVRDVLLELIEEAEDTASLDSAYAEPDAGKSRPFEDVVRELGLGA